MSIPETIRAAVYAGDVEPIRTWFGADDYGDTYHLLKDWMATITATERTREVTEWLGSKDMAGIGFLWSMNNEQRVHDERGSCGPYCVLCS